MIFNILDFYDFSFQFLIFKIFFFLAFSSQDFNITPEFQGVVFSLSLSIAATNFW
jgi:hypothetical protein